MKMSSAGWLITSGIINVEIQGLVIQVISSVMALEVLLFKIDEAQDIQTKLFTLSPFMFEVWRIKNLYWMILSRKPSINETERPWSPNKINKSEKTIPIERGLVSRTSHSESVSTCLVIEDLDPHQLFAFSSVRKCVARQEVVSNLSWSPVMTHRLICEYCNCSVVWVTLELWRIEIP